MYHLQFRIFCDKMIYYLRLSFYNGLDRGNRVSKKIVHFVTQSYKVIMNPSDQSFICCTLHTNDYVTKAVSLVKSKNDRVILIFYHILDSLYMTKGHPFL